MYRVLIVDDEPIHRRGLSNMLSKLRPDYNILCAENGVEALEYIKNYNINIMITDIKMPIMDGLQLIEKMGNSIRHIKVIILSVYGYFDYGSVIDWLSIIKPIEKHLA